MEKIRLQIDITSAFSEELERLIEVTGLSTKKELIGNAITMFSWAVTQYSQGFTIASVTGEGEVWKELAMPSLDHAYLYGKNSQKMLDNW